MSHHHQTSLLSLVYMAISSGREDNIWSGESHTSSQTHFRKSSIFSVTSSVFTVSKIVLKSDTTRTYSESSIYIYCGSDQQHQITSTALCLTSPELGSATKETNSPHNLFLSTLSFSTLTAQNMRWNLLKWHLLLVLSGTNLWPKK